MSDSQNTARILPELFEEPISSSGEAAYLFYCKRLSQNRAQLYLRVMLHCKIICISAAPISVSWDCHLLNDSLQNQMPTWQFQNAFFHFDVFVFFKSVVKVLVDGEID